MVQLGWISTPTILKELLMRLFEMFFVYVFHLFVPGRTELLRCAGRTIQSGPKRSGKIYTVLCWKVRSKLAIYNKILRNFQILIFLLRKIKLFFIFTGDIHIGFVYYSLGLLWPWIRIIKRTRYFVQFHSHKEERARECKNWTFTSRAYQNLTEKSQPVTSLDE